jgi:hypothetical protein
MEQAAASANDIQRMQLHQINRYDILHRGYFERIRGMLLRNNTGLSCDHSASSPCGLFPTSSQNCCAVISAYNYVIDGHTAMTTG